jgi:hypothetical protein
MSITISKESENLIVVHVKGTYTIEDENEAENAEREVIDRCGKYRVLVLAEQFSGWGKEGDWGDLTFMYESDPYIEKMAIVAQNKWKEQILMFVGAGRRQAIIEYFLPGEAQAARDWLQSENQ